MDLKFQNELSNFSECDLSDFSQRQRIAYRYVFNDIMDERNFSPMYAIPNCNKIKDTCIGYALSMFDEVNQAKARIKKLAKGKKLIYKRLGTHIAVGTLEEGYGISNNSSISQENLGHFSFFDYMDVELNSSFQIIEVLYGETT
jgi:hypothetical protein